MSLSADGGEQEEPSAYDFRSSRYKLCSTCRDKIGTLSEFFYSFLESNRDTISSTAYQGVLGHSEIFGAGAIEPQYVNASDWNDVVFTSESNDYSIAGLGRDFVISGMGDDVIVGDRNAFDETTSDNQNTAAAADAIYAREGNDMVYAGGGNNWVDAGAGNDSVWGGSGNELLQGGLGDDIINAGAGNDMLFGGYDTAARQVSFVNANIGAISIQYNGASDTEAPGTLNPTDYIISVVDVGSDYLDGGAGNDVINGQDGADTMIGGVGNDKIYVDNLGDIVREFVGEGADTVLASVSYTLKAGVEVEQLSTSNTGSSGSITLGGNEFAQKILGNQGGNKLAGYGGDDQLFGYSGGDALYGGLGADKLSGGLGNDAFVFDTKLGNGNIDTVSDFHNVSGDNDTIRLDNAVFTLLGNAANANNFAFNASGTSTQPDDYIIYNTTNGTLTYDTNGSMAGGAVQFAVITGHPALTLSDFLVI